MKKSHFDHQCDDLGLPCPDGYKCYCKPCIKAFEVDVLQWDETDDIQVDSGRPTGCDKMVLCGTVQQTKEAVFRVYDNRERDDAEVSAVMHVGQSSHVLPVKKLENESYAYEFSYTDDQLGVAILEVYVDEEQIPESPFRVQIVDRDCEVDFPGKGKQSVCSITSFLCISIVIQRC